MGDVFATLGAVSILVELHHWSNLLANLRGEKPGLHVPWLGEMTTESANLGCRGPQVETCLTRPDFLAWLDTDFGHQQTFTNDRTSARFNGLL